MNSGCWMCRLKKWWRELFMNYYCHKCDVVSPPTTIIKTHRRYIGWQEVPICGLCQFFQNGFGTLHTCTKEDVERMRKSKANTERHVREQKEFRRLKAERRAKNKEK